MHNFSLSTLKNEMATHKLSCLNLKSKIQLIIIICLKKKKANAGSPIALRGHD